MDPPDVFDGFKCASMTMCGCHVFRSQEGPNTNVKTLAIDLAKRVFFLHGEDEVGHVALREKVMRARLVERIAQLPPCTVVMEACGGLTMGRDDSSNMDTQPAARAMSYTPAACSGRE
jgi:hypothetical protein